MRVEKSVDTAAGVCSAGSPVPGEVCQNFEDVGTAIMENFGNRFERFELDVCGRIEQLEIDVKKIQGQSPWALYGWLGVAIGVFLVFSIVGIAALAGGSF